MLSVEEARATVLQAIQPRGTEIISFTEAPGRVLAEEVIADAPVPPFHQSAMDGFAVRAADTLHAKADHPISLNILGTLGAGHTASWTLTPGTAVRIMTGAPLPKGADAVVKRENTQSTADCVKVFQAAPPGDHIIPPGRDIPRGASVLRRGEVLTPGAVGLLASLGHTQVRVYQRPTVAILALGDELVPPDAPLAPGQIRVSNLYTVAAGVTKYGGQPCTLGIARDQLEMIQGALAGASAADLLVTLGGSQRGDFDLVDDLLSGERGSIVFREIAANYGRSMIFGRWRNIPLFGLPGSPMTAFVTFEAFVRPALWKLAGRGILHAPRVEAILSEPLPATPARAHIQPVWVEIRPEGLTALPLRIAKAPDLPPQTLANGLVYRQAGSNATRAGERVWVELVEAVAHAHSRAV